jgi:hypothetical protein
MPKLDDPDTCATAEDVIRNHAAGLRATLQPACIYTLAAHPDHRLRLVTVRMGRCRFIAAAQDVPQIIRALNNSHTHAPTKA